MGHEERFFCKQIEGRMQEGLLLLVVGDKAAAASLKSSS